MKCKLVLPCFILATTLSSFLLFLIQPLAAKALLPVFGGAPAVWNVCMVFFQGVLLLGYLYVYMSTRFLTPAWQRLLHFLLIGVSVLMLPILWVGVHSAEGSDPTWSVLQLLLLKLSLPLLVVSATAPLIQSWFSQTDHLHAKDPYFLYSASNVGSLLALLGFPFLFEPFLGLQRLSGMWSVLYGLFAILIFWSASQRYNQVVVIPSVHKQETVRWQQRGFWLLLSFAPSSLLLAVTQHITINIAATPLLWILPLAIYLSAFIITFARKPLISQRWMAREQVYFLILPLLSMCKSVAALPAWQLITFHMLGFFALVMVCLGQLVASRPAKENLTEFYCWLALGGFCGGVFNSIVAPLIFKGVYEYYIAFFLCVLLGTWSRRALFWKVSDNIMLLLVLFMCAFDYFCHDVAFYPVFFKYLALFVEFSVVALIVCLYQRSLCFVSCLAVLFLYGQVIPGVGSADLLWQSRNFFGVTKVYKSDPEHLHYLISGSTLHGAQVLSDKNEFNHAMTYYTPVQLAVNFLHDGKLKRRVAIAGLGAGTLSCQFKKSDALTFFEIDPAVVHVAATPQFFTYLTACKPKGGIVVGDARLSLTKLPEHYFDIIVLDAFSSDNIPIHLLTLEAIQVYLQKLTADGVLIFNISNTYLDLAPVLATLAAKLDLQALIYEDKVSDVLRMKSEWVVLTANREVGEQLRGGLGWQDLVVSGVGVLWTDDYSGILRVLR